MALTLQSVAVVFGLLLPYGTVQALPSHHSCCKAFRRHFPASQIDLVFPDAYSSVQESDIVASCRINPTSAEEVAQVLNITTESGCNFAVRSGGHMPWAGSANIEEPGVAIDLGFLNKTTLSNDKSIAHVGPGARWGLVYDALAPEGRVVIGGRGEHIGVGGYLLGGGISFFSEGLGFASDNVVGYEIVLANGTIAEANSQENTDLFWALRLGSTNFGIVTRFDLKTTTTTNLWGGLRNYNRSHALQAAEALIETNQRSQEQGAGLDTLGLFIGNGDEFLMNYAHLKPENDTDVFEPALDIPFTSDTVRSNVTLKTILQELDALFPIGRHVSFRTLAFVPDAQFMIDWWQEGFKIFAQYEGNSNLSWTFTYAIIPVSMMRAAEAANDPYGLDASNGPLILTNLNAFWSDSLDEDDVQCKLAELLEWGKTTAQERGLLNDWVYLNYASPDQDPYAGIPEANARRLRHIRQSVDPNDILQNLWPGGFKL